jgi:hypothetical protein
MGTDDVDNAQERKKIVKELSQKKKFDETVQRLRLEVHKTRI